MADIPEAQRVPHFQSRRGLIAFLTVERTQDQAGFIGAIMVTDERGYPLEFRCTTPVRPTAIQSALYGSLLERFVGVELCGRRLLAEVQRKPHVVIVPSSELLALDEGNTPVVAVRRVGEIIEVESVAQELDRQRLESSSGHFQPVILMTRRDRREHADDVRELLTATFQHFDLVEPFERIRTALKVLAEQDPRFR